MSNFKYAVANKLRFPYKGQISVEDLFDLNLDALNVIFQTLSKQVKVATEESLLAIPTKEDEERNIKIAIVKEIFEDKKQAIEDRKNAVAKKAQKQKIMAIIAEKEDDVLKNMSIEDLKKLADSFTE